MEVASVGGRRPRVMPRRILSEILQPRAGGSSISSGTRFAAPATRRPQPGSCSRVAARSSMDYPKSPSRSSICRSGGARRRRRRPRRPRQQSRVRIGRGTDTLRAARPDGGRRRAEAPGRSRESRDGSRRCSASSSEPRSRGRPDRHRDGSVTGLAPARIAGACPLGSAGERARHCRTGASRPGCRDARRPTALAARGRVQFAGTTAFAGSSEVL